MSRRQPVIDTPSDEVLFRSQASVDCRRWWAVSVTMWKSVTVAVLAILAYELIRSYRSKTIIIDRKVMMEKYDYIVVGGGSAGTVVSSRLSELPNATILVLEAGHNDEDFPETQWLPMEQRLQLGDFDWHYRTVPQRNCCDGLIDKSSFWPRGKGLGGCSSHFGAVHVRGSRYDYEQWNAEFDGKGGWGYKDVLPYFKKLENVRAIPELSSNEETRNLHGFDGPIVLTQTPWAPLGQGFVDASTKRGYKWIEDYNAMGEGVAQEGFSKIQRARREDGRRMNTAEGYLRPAARLRPDRLHILTMAHVTKILFDGNTVNPTAIGVQFMHGNKLHVVYANKEVIISAGSINTPQLMMLSGIGPKDHLKEHGIPVVVDTPAVGQNLYDHPFARLSGTINNASALYQHLDLDNPVDVALAKLKYYLMGAGPLAYTAVEWQAFLRSGVTEEKWPDMQLYLMTARYCWPHKVFNMNDKAIKAMEPPEAQQPGRYWFGIPVVLLKPHNSGTIRLQSSNPFDHPLIDPKYFDNDIDAAILAKGLKILMEISGSDELKKYDLRIEDKHAPGCEHLELMSDEYLKCHARSTATTMYHPVGTCRMGKKGNNSVVDQRLRVHGIRNLRIVDASVFPYQIAANTNAATIMIAEKAADMIKEAYTC